jgi:transglutaminase-like putative cysteine protease
MFAVTEAADVALQVAPAATAGTVIEERLEVMLDGAPITPSAEVVADHGGRIHVVSASPGTLSLAYSGTLLANPPPTASPVDTSRGLDAIVALRQSRYCPSDTLAGFATTEFADSVGASADEIALRVASWVFERLAYAVGSSGPLDTAVETLLSGSGVCRDFAQLTITLCRALNVPARLAAVYAPGLSPMDFHAVVEFLTPVGWRVLDPTRLAPRSALVRIATGRDASDTAFATTLRGTVELVGSRVFASSDGLLPADDHTGPLPLA